MAYSLFIGIQPLTALPAPEETIQDKIERYAKIYSVSPDLMRHIISRESRYKVDAVGDTNYTCPRTGKIAPSRGLVQINECWWPEEVKQAYNPDFAIEFLAKKLSEGKCNLWSTCPRNL